MDTEQVQRLLEGIVVHARVHLPQLLVGIPLTLLHGEGDIHLGLGQNLPKAPVFLVCGLEAEELVGHVVRDAGAQLGVFLVQDRLAVVLGLGPRVGIINFRHDDSPFIFFYPYFFQSKMAFSSQFSQASNPSPVLEDTWNTSMSGFSPLARRMQASTSKSK